MEHQARLDRRENQELQAGGEAQVSRAARETSVLWGCRDQWGSRDQRERRERRDRWGCEVLLDLLDRRESGETLDTAGSGVRR